jgi:long-chain acyl-CoA synthetase
MAQLIADHLDKADEPALIDAAGTTTWGELNTRVNQLINHLRTAGIEPGERVALLSGNRREVFEVLLACGHAGWLTVPINWHFAADEVEYVIENSGAKHLIVDPVFAGLAAEVTVPRLTFGEGGSYEQALGASSADEPGEQMLGGVMFYTSGTTGRPKGVMNTAFGAGVPPEVMKLIAGSMVNVGLPAGGRTLLCGPHYHSAQWAFSYMPMINGSTVVLQDRFVPEQTLELIDEHQVTNVHLVPTQFVRLLRVDDERRAAFRGESLQLVLHGAAPCSPDIKRQMLEWWGPKISEYYGATEGGVVSMITGEEWLRKPGSVGPAMPICEIKIVPDDGTDAAPFTEGVIHVRNKMGTDFEYLGEPEKTAEAHREPGYFTLGDIGYLDDDGYLYLSDRKIDMIISGGVNIYPAEIEGVLVTHPSVVDVAVFGIPNEEFGEEVKAAVQLAEGTTWTAELGADLDQFARQRLAGYKAPRSYDVVAEMPRSDAGKLIKRQLRNPYWEAAGRKI